MDDDVVNQPDNSANETEDEQLDREGESLVPELEEDNDTPFSPPTDPVTDGTVGSEALEDTGGLDATHQATDSATNIDSQELYDEGLPGAAESGEPNANNAVVDYEPDQDERTTTP